MAEPNHGHPGCQGVRMLPAGTPREPWTVIFTDLFRDLAKKVLEKERELEIGS